MAPSTSPLTSAEDDQLLDTERTPLLATSEALPVDETQVNGNPNRPSLPPTLGQSDEGSTFNKSQILLLCYVRLFEPIAFFSIFPFVNQMIWETGAVAKADVGFYSGLIESLFSLTQMIFMIPWGRLADHPKIGRKPVLVFSLIGVAINMALFGMSKTVWQMVLFRCLAGIFAGTIVTIRTMISENCSPKTQARAFSFFAFTGNLGIFLGPLLGGALADPAREYPRVFGKIQFFKDFPYALPTVVAGAIGMSAALVAALFVNETLTPKTSKAGSNSSPDGPTSIWDILKAPGVIAVLYLYGHIMLLAFAYTAVIPVFWFTPVALGGFGFSPLMISIFMGAGGASQAIWILVVFPYLQKRFSTGGVLRGCGIAYPFFFLAYPMCNIFLKKEWKAAFWVVAAFTTVFGSGVSMSFTAIQLALNDISPSPATLGTLNALALTVISGIRSFSPALFTSIFASGVRRQILDGYLVWVVMIILAFGYLLAARYLPARAEGRLDKDERVMDGTVNGDAVGDEHIA